MVMVARSVQYAVKSRGQWHFEDVVKRRDLRFGLENLMHARAPAFILSWFRITGVGRGLSKFWLARKMSIIT